MNISIFLDLRCAYCEMHYEVIGKVETFSEDFHYLEHISLLGRNKTGRMDLPVLNTVPHDIGRGKQYFATLDSKRRQDLYRLYKPDFDLFDYEAGSYGVREINSTFIKSQN